MGPCLHGAVQPLLLPPLQAPRPRRHLQPRLGGRDVRCARHLFAAKVAAHEALLAYAGRAARSEDADLFFVPVYVSGNFSTPNPLAVARPGPARRGRRPRPGPDATDPDAVMSWTAALAASAAPRHKQELHRTMAIVRNSMYSAIAVGRASARRSSMRSHRRPCLWPPPLHAADVSRDSRGGQVPHRLDAARFCCCWVVVIVWRGEIGYRESRVAARGSTQAPAVRRSPWSAERLVSSPMVFLTNDHTRVLVAVAPWTGHSTSTDGQIPRRTWQEQTEKKKGRVKF